MMKTVNKITLLIVCLLISLFANAQIKLSKEEKETLQNVAKQKIDFFQDQLSAIASSKISPENKNRAVKSTLSIFIGKGEPYVTYGGDNFTEEEHNSGVKMQTSSINSRAKKAQLMKKYLERMKGMLNYTEVVIESSDAVKIGDIYLDPATNRYISTASFCQHFAGYRDGYKVYEDYTVKKVKIYIDPSIVELPDGKHTVWLVQLGDMSVVETW